MIHHLALAALALAIGAQASAREPPGLDRALRALEGAGRFSGAVVVRDWSGERFARGYGLSDPFLKVAFGPHTQSESGSLAKPVTAAIILTVEREGKLSLDQPVRQILTEYPDPVATIRHLMTHSAGLPDYDRFQPIAGKTTAQMLSALTASGWAPEHRSGTRFQYCNLCFDSLALIAERVEGRSFHQILESRLFRRAELTRSRVRPVFLSDWTDRAIGYRQSNGKMERFDSWDGEAFYGASNIAFTASDLARLGYWLAAAAPPWLRSRMTAPGLIDGRKSGLTLGNLYCSPDGERCHYVGHHEGFHALLYWDGGRRLSVSMISNNTLAPSLQQRLQRALVAFAEGRVKAARREIELAVSGRIPFPGNYRSGSDRIWIGRASGPILTVRRFQLEYDAFPVGEGHYYAPGLDAYMTWLPNGRLRWTTLYDDRVFAPPVAASERI